MRAWLSSAAHGLMTVLTAIVMLVVVVPYSRLQRLARRRPRVLWGPTPILSLARLAEGDRLRGLQSDTLVYDVYHLSSQFDYNLKLAARPAWQRLIIPYGVFLWAACRYDVFQFYYDQGLLPGKDRFTFHRWELPLLALAGKATILSAYGADVRYRSRAEQDQPYNACMDCPSPGVLCVCDETKATANYAQVRRWASECLSLGDCLEYTPGSRNDVFYLPIDLKQVPFVGATAEPGRPVRIVHAPNHRSFKGTRFLLEAVETLKAEGHALELDLVEGMPNAIAKQHYAAADIIADQFIIGWAGYFAVEAMAMGKPVICFIRRPDYLIADIPCPIVSASPDDLTDALRRLIVTPELRQALGEQGRRYVEAVYDLPKVAERMASVYAATWGNS
jgi:glycosyltransferase involved in cell wall biosynthesis